MLVQARIQDKAVVKETRICSIEAVLIKAIKVEVSTGSLWVPHATPMETARSSNRNGETLNEI